MKRGTTVRWVAGCSAGLMLAWHVAAESTGTPELVLAPQTRLVANTSIGSVSVLAGDALERRVEWQGCTLRALPSARAGRWFGSLGLYDPAPGGVAPFVAPKACEGISRPVFQEGQLHFPDVQAAETWLKRYAQTRSTVWTHDGLVLQWARDPSRAQLSVDVWQICVHGQAPAQLSGAADDAIQLVARATEGQPRRACAVVPDEVARMTVEAWTTLWKQADQMRQQTRSTP